MKIRILLILVLMISLQYSCSKTDDGVDFVDFLGKESYFKFFEEIIPETLKDTLVYYNDSIGYNYLRLDRESPFATFVEGIYTVHQNVFIDYGDPFEIKNIGGLETCFIFEEQKNAILSATISIDTIVDLYSQISYKIDQTTHADTLYVVGSIEKDFFMMYGYADNHIERAYLDSETMSILENTHQTYQYKSIVIIVGEKIEDGLRRIAFFEYISDIDESFYPIGSIRAFADDDDFSYMVK